MPRVSFARPMNLALLLAAAALLLVVPVGAEQLAPAPANVLPLHPECMNIPTSAGQAPADLMAHCRSVLRGDAPIVPNAPTDMAVGSEGINAQCAELTLNNPAGMTRFGSLAFQPACDLAGDDLNTLYCYDFSVPAVFSSVNADTCAQTILGSANNTGAQSFAGMTWDHTTGTMYASTTDIVTSQLHTVNLATGATTFVGNVTNAPGLIALATDNDGNLFGFDIVLDSLVAVNKTTGAGTVIGPIGFDANFAQGMDFDNDDGTCYIFAFNNGAFAGELRTCNTATGGTTLVGPLGGGFEEITGVGIKTLPAGGGGGIECEDVTRFQGRCIRRDLPGNRLLVRVTLSDTSHSGESVEIMVDGTPVSLEVMNRQAKYVENDAAPGLHTISLSDPAGCFDDLVLRCPE